MPYRNGRPGALGAAELDDEPAMEQRPERVVRVDAADPLDRRLRDRLAVGDDRERLERGRRQADRVGADVAGDQRAGLGRRDELDPVAVDDEADAALGEAHLEVAEARVDRRPIDAGERRDLAPGERPLGDEQQRLELGLGQLGAALLDGRQPPDRLRCRPRPRSASSLPGPVVSSSVTRTTPGTRRAAILVGRAGGCDVPRPSSPGDDRAPRLGLLDDDLAPLHRARASRGT